MPPRNVASQRLAAPAEPEEPRANLCLGLRLFTLWESKSPVRSVKMWKHVETPGDIWANINEGFDKKIIDLNGGSSIEPRLITREIPVWNRNMLSLHPPNHCLYI